MEFIVGTVLAGIPIVLEAYDRYWDLSAGCSTFRNYSKELTKLDTIMKTQKTLFRGNVVKLLIAITNDPEKARDLLSSNKADVGKALWELKIHGRNRIESLKEAFESWEMSLRQIYAAVTAICLEMESFRSTSVPPSGHSLLSKEAIKQLPKRFKLSWKKQEVQDSIKELREFVSDFNELTTRIISDLQDVQSPQAPVRQMSFLRTPNNLNSIEKYGQIRLASFRLYNTFALRWSCAKHANHAAAISLADGSVHPQGRPQKTSNGITFEIAISCESASPTCCQPPILLEVESVDSSAAETPADDEPDDAWAAVMGTITKHAQQVVIEKHEVVHKKLVKKAVRFSPPAVTTSFASDGSSTSPMAIAQDETSHNAEGTGETNFVVSTVSTSPTGEPVVDLEMIEDFCRHFQIPRPIRRNVCVGYLKDLSLHRFYIPPPERQLSGQQKSLAEIISWVSEDEVTRSLSRTAMAHLASSLAAAVLQYHSTPWLPETWQSSQVGFFGIGELVEDAGNISTASPYFKVHLSKLDKGQARDSSPLSPKRTTTAPGNESNPSVEWSTQGDENTTPSPMRNELLFRFGIVLLELGYSQPWPSLKSRVFASLPPPRRTDYHAAEKLAQMPFLRDRMGPRFPTIVRKCLGCDFGLGENDLASKELQGMFLVDVVGALQEAERGLRELESRFGNAGF